MISRPARAIGYAASGVVILAFAVVLVFALTELRRTEEELRANTGDNMLWAISRAQSAMEQLDAAAARRVAGSTDADALRLRYNIALSRVNLLTAGPQRRYLADLGFVAVLKPRLAAVKAMDARIVALSPGDHAAARKIHAVLGPLVRALGHAANASMVAHLDRTGAGQDTIAGGIRQVSVSIIVIIGLGIVIAASMVRTMAVNVRAERSLKREQELRELYRTFVALVSHQFQTPLSVIDASAQRLIRRGGEAEPDEVVARAWRIRATVSDLTLLIAATLENIRLDSGQVRPNMVDCTVAALIDDVKRKQIETHRERDVVCLIDDDVPPRLRTDPVLVEQVLANLLSNALKYSPADTRVELQVMRGECGIGFFVRDHGPGIDAGERKKVFDDFFRASATHHLPGRGIGLNVSRKIAALLGGRLELAKSGETGSLFVLSLPLASG